MTELNMKDDQEKEWPTPIRLAEIDAQQKIMARVDELMTEATQTKRSAPNAARPFWAQTQVDIPPSEKFGKLSQMTEDDSQKNAPQRAEEEVTAPAPPPIPQPAAQAEGSEATALSAIRDEVINKMGAAAPAMPSPELDEVLQRLDGLEGRVDKHQQDLTALLKLVRQLAAKKEEKPAPSKLPPRYRYPDGSPWYKYPIAFEEVRCRNNRFELPPPRAVLAGVGTFHSIPY